MSALVDNFQKVEKVPGWVEYRLGVYGSRDPGFVNVDRSATSFDETDLWDIHLHVCGAATIQEISGLDAALALALHLWETLAPMQALSRERADRRYQEGEERRRARLEEERPAREKAAREREERLAVAPTFEAGKCPECGHVAEEEEFDERGYECSRCGSHGRGEDGRRCDQCHIFRARVSDLSCPECEEPVESLEKVTVKSDGGDLIEVDDVGDDQERTPTS